MRNQNFRAELQPTKRSTGNRLEWGAHNPNLKAHHLVHTKIKKINNQNEWLADVEYEESIRNLKDFVR